MADMREFPDQSLIGSGSARATALLSFGLVANLATQMTFAASLHEIAADWALDASQSGWIGGVYFAGYAVAVPFLASATDRMDGRALYAGAALLGRLRASRLPLSRTVSPSHSSCGFSGASASPASTCPA